MGNIRVILEVLPEIALVPHRGSEIIEPVGIFYKSPSVLQFEDRLVVNTRPAIRRQPHQFPNLHIIAKTVLRSPMIEPAYGMQSSIGMHRISLGIKPHGRNVLIKAFELMVLIDVKAVFLRVQMLYLLLHRLRNDSGIAQIATFIIIAATPVAHQYGA